MKPLRHLLELRPKKKQSNVARQPCWMVMSWPTAARQSSLQTDWSYQDPWSTRSGTPAFFINIFFFFWFSISKVVSMAGSSVDGAVRNALLTISCSSSSSEFLCRSLWLFVFDDSIQFLVCKMLTPKAFKKSECVNSRLIQTALFGSKRQEQLLLKETPSHRPRFPWNWKFWNCPVMTALPAGAACDGSQPPTTLSSTGTLRCVTLEQQEPLPVPEHLGQSGRRLSGSEHTQKRRGLRADQRVWGSSEETFYQSPPPFNPRFGLTVPTKPWSGCTCRRAGTCLRDAGSWSPGPSWELLMSWLGLSEAGQQEAPYFITTLMTCATKWTLKKLLRKEREPQLWRQTSPQFWTQRAQLKVRRSA